MDRYASLTGTLSSSRVDRPWFGFFVLATLVLSACTSSSSPAKDACEADNGVYCGSWCCNSGYECDGKGPQGYRCHDPASKCPHSCGTDVCKPYNDNPNAPASDWSCVAGCSTVADCSKTMFCNSGTPCTCDNSPWGYVCTAHL